MTKQRIVTTPDCLGSSSGYRYPAATYVAVPQNNNSFVLSILTHFVNPQKDNAFRLFAPNGTLFKVLDDFKTDAWVDYRIDTKGNPGIWKVLSDPEAEGCYMLRTTGKVDLYRRPKAGSDMVEGLRTFTIHPPGFGGSKELTLFIEVIPGMKRFTIRVNEPRALEEGSVRVYCPDGKCYEKADFARGRDYSYACEIECGKLSGLWRLDMAVGDSPLQLTTGEHLRIFFGPRLTMPVKVKVRTLDSLGAAIPARVSFISNDRETLFTGFNGEGTVFLYPSRYKLEASHGFEYRPVEKEFAVYEGGRPQSLNIKLERVVKRKKGWYCGDQHVHTTYSYCGNNSVPEMVSAAISEGLDWLVLTDHRYPCPEAEMSTTYSMEEITASTVQGRLIGIAGQEVAVGDGFHCNVIGTTKAFNIKSEGRGTTIGPADISKAVRLQNSSQHPLALVVNHPPVGSLPQATILRMLKRYEHLQNIEIWNPGGYDAMQLWFSLLNRGYHIFAVANTDTHDRAIWPPGMYRTYCYLGKDVTASRIIEAIKEGHSFCSRGAFVYLTINGKMPGETVRVKQKEKLRIRVIVDSVNPVKQIAVIKNGLVTEWMPCSWSHFDREVVVEADKSCWYLCHCVNADASLLFPSTAEFTKYLCHAISGDAFTNPIFVEVTEA